MNESRNLLIVLGKWWEQRRTVASKDGQRQQRSRIRRILRWLTPNGGTLLLVAALVLTQRVWAGPLASPTGATLPTEIDTRYQGLLAGQDGSPVPDGSYGMDFALYDALSGGSLLWTMSRSSVPVSDGLFSVTLEDIPIDVLLAYGSSLFLEVIVEGEALSPRERIQGAPMAGLALAVPDGAISNEKLALSYWQANPENEPIIVQSTSENSPTEIIRLDVNLNVDGVYLVFAKVISQAEDGEQVVAEVWDESGFLPKARTFTTHSQTGVDGRESSTIVTMRPFSAGQHTIRLMAYMGEGDKGKIRGYTELYVIPLGQQ